MDPVRLTDGAESLPLVSLGQANQPLQVGLRGKPCLMRQFQLLGGGRLPYLGLRPAVPFQGDNPPPPGFTQDRLRILESQQPADRS